MLLMTREPLIPAHPGLLTGFTSPPIMALTVAGSSGVTGDPRETRVAPEVKNVLGRNSWR
jgi:hypothetical protein